MNYDFFEPLPKIIPVGKTTKFVLCEHAGCCFSFGSG